MRSLTNAILGTKVCQIASLILLVGLSQGGWAQIDPSSALLLRSGSESQTKVPLDSGRYMVRPSERSASGTPDRPERIERPERNEPTKAQESKPPEIVQTKIVAPEAKGEAAPAKPASVEEGSVTKAVEDLFLGGKVEELDVFRSRLEDSDPRKNLIDLSLAPSFIYFDSSSNYWFRNYQGSTPGFLVDAAVWATPFFGVAMGYHTSLNASISDGPGSINKEAAEHQWFSAGARVRKFFGTTRDYNTIVFGVDYADYKLHVPPDAALRIGVKTSGIKISVDAYVSTSSTFAFNFGGSFTPRAGHNETAGLTRVKSGEKSSSTALSFWLGGTHTFDRRSQIFWKLQQSLERNIFSGEADTSDPKTGTSPTGVSVQQSFSIFQLGYRWGN